MLPTQLVQPPFPQDPAFHMMADQRTLLRIPNCLNILSNLPFAVVGALGLRTILGREGKDPGLPDGWERWPYAALFAGTALTTAGSAYYHLDPGNWRLVWDRLPMTFGFMGLLTAVLSERLGAGAGRIAFGPLLLLGVSSVAFWYWTELHGQGDLRPYLLVQYGSLFLVLLLVLVHSAKHSSTAYILGSFVMYALATCLE